jgi:hypothetical protein
MDSDFWEYSPAVSRIRLQDHEFLRQIVKNRQVGEEIERSVFLELRDISVSATKCNTDSSIVTKIA